MNTFNSRAVLGHFSMLLLCDPGVPSQPHWAELLTFVSFPTPFDVEKTEILKRGCWHAACLKRVFSVPSSYDWFMELGNNSHKRGNCCSSSRVSTKTYDVLNAGFSRRIPWKTLALKGIQAPNFKLFTGRIKGHQPEHECVHGVLEPNEEMGSGRYKQYK